MGITKSEFFSEKQNSIAGMLKAIGHPARVAIIEHLLQVKSCICNDLVDVLPLAQPTVSQHLKELKNVGLIKGNVEGTSICYCLDMEAISLLQSYFSTISNQLEQNKNSCC